MITIVRDLRDAAVRLPLDRDRAARARMVFIELAAARGIVAALGYYDIIGLSTFATNLLTTLAIAAGTDYAIFLVGRYHEARATARTAKPPSTPCIMAPPTSSWARV